MKKINAWEETTTINDKFCTITLIEIENVTYDAYIGNDQEPMQYMFGLPVRQQSAKEAMEIAIKNAADYTGLLEA